MDCHQEVLEGAGWYDGPVAGTTATHSAQLESAIVPMIASAAIQANFDAASVHNAGAKHYQPGE
jgi:hypothetical protein